MSRAREALAAQVEKTGMDIARSGIGMTTVGQLGQIAVLIRRGGTDPSGEADASTRRAIESIAPVAGIPLLAEGALLEWFDLMLRVEEMDRLLAGGREAGRDGAEARWVVLDEIADWPENGPVVRDGQTRGRTA